MMSCRRALAIGLALYLVLLSACSPQGTPSASSTAASSAAATTVPDNQTLTIALFGGFQSDMNPYNTQGRGRGNLENIYEPLVAAAPVTLEIKGVLADSWTVSSDGTTYRFALKKGVSFHDGTPFDAESVKLSYELIRKIAKSDMEPFLRNVKSTRVIDANTIEFVVDPTGFPFLNRLPGLSIASAKAIKEHDVDMAWWGNSAVGTGPYKLERWAPKDRMVLVRNDNWWGQKPFFQHVVFLEVPEASAQALMIKSGDADIVYNVPPDSLAAFKNDPNLRVLNEPGDRVLNIRMNVNRAPLNNKVLRQALANAFDYDAIVQARSQQVGPTNGPVPAAFLGGWTAPNLVKKQDLEKAKALLAQAGYKPGDLKLDINVVKNDPLQLDTAQILVSSLGKIGVTATLRQVDFNATLAHLLKFAADPKANANEAQGLDMMTFVRGPFVPDPYAYFSNYELGQNRNFYAYSNPDAFSLIAKGYRASSRGEALSFQKQGVQAIVDDQPDIWPYVERHVVVLRANIDGYYMHPTWFPETQVWTIRRKAN